MKSGLNRNSNIFIQENAFESVVCETAAILSRPQCVSRYHCGDMSSWNTIRWGPTSASIHTSDKYSSNPGDDEVLWLGLRFHSQNSTIWEIFDERVWSILYSTEWRMSPGDHCRDYYPGALSCSQLSATHFKIWHLQVPDLQLCCLDMTIK